MKIEFLGSGGALPMPRPGCICPLCEEAREKGVPYSRLGPSLFVHGPDLLIDTPEEVSVQINRARLSHVPHATYSHWHPDHTMGRRIWEMNVDWRNWPPQNHQTTIYLPQQVAADFQERLGLKEHLAYLQHLGVIQLVTLTDGEQFTLNNVVVRPFRVAEEYVYAFLLEEDGRRVLLAPDELLGWQPPEFVHGVDLVVLPMGIVEFNPFTGERQIPLEHPVLKLEATFRQTLEMVRVMQPRRVLMTHIEEADQLGYDDLLRLEEMLREDGYPIQFAYDTLLVEV